MAVEIKVPDMGESVVEATVARWIKQEGEQVSAGEPVVELETDKINLEVGAAQAGVLEKILKQAGETVMVGDVLATVGGGGGAPAGQPGGSAEPAPAPYQSSTQAPRGEDTEQEQRAPAAQGAGAGGTAGTSGTAEGQAAEAAPLPYQASTESAPGTAPRGQDIERTGEAQPSTQGAAVSATPVAIRMAQDLGIDLSKVNPSGPGGRITREDVQAFANKEPSKPGAAAQPAAAPVAKPEAKPAAQPARPPAAAPAPSADGQGANRRETRERMSRRRQTIARRLVEAQQTAAMLTTFNEIDMSAVMELRKRRREGFKERYGVDLGFMSFFVKATIGALKAFPNLNAEIQGEEIVHKHYYDIGVAIGAEEGLVVPVIRDADALNFAGIEKAIREFVGKVKEGTLTLEDLRGGTFTITNGGVYGSLMSTPILNPPQVGILGMHAIKERPVVVDGQIVARPMMYVALSYDHRIVDGREAVQFLVRLKELVEDPETLLFG